MGLNLAKLKEVEDEVTTTPLDKEDVETPSVAEIAAESKTVESKDEFAELVAEITPSDPPVLEDEVIAPAAAGTKEPEDEPLVAEVAESADISVAPSETPVTDEGTSAPVAELAAETTPSDPPVLEGEIIPPAAALAAEITPSDPLVIEGEIVAPAAEPTKEDEPLVADVAESADISVTPSETPATDEGASSESAADTKDPSVSGLGKLNLSKLSQIEDEVITTPFDKAEVEEVTDAETATASVESTTTVSNEYAALVVEITPSEPPTIDNEVSGSKGDAPTTEQKVSESITDSTKVRDNIADVIRSAGTAGERPTPNTNDSIGDYSDVLASMDPEAVREIEGRAKSITRDARARRAGVDPAEMREAMQEQEQNRQFGRPQQAQGSGGAGLLDLAAGLIAAPFVGAALGVSKFRRIMADAKGCGTAPDFSSDALRDRIYDLKAQQMQSNAVAMLDATKTLGDHINAFNQEFHNSDRMAAFMNEVSKVSGKSAADVLDDVTNGKATPSQVAAVRDVLSDPKVAAAWQKVETQVDELQKSQNIVKRDFDLLNKNFPEKFDAEAEAETLEKVANESVAALPKPVVEDPDKDKKLAERLREMAENLIERIRELIAKIMNMGRGS